MFKYLKLIITFLLFFIFVFSQAGAEEILTWQDCIKEAAENHPDLISGKEAVKESQADKRVTISTFLPQIDSSVSGSTAKTTTTTSGVTTSKTTDTYSYGLTGTQLLFDGFKTYDNIKAASENIRAAEYNYKFTSSEVRLRLRTAFINLLKAEELLNITQEIYNIRKNNLVLITLSYESGLEHKGALLNAEANLDSAKFEISQAKRTLEVAQRELIKEIGRTTFSPLRVQGDFKVSDAVLEKPDFEVMVNNHPYLAKLIAQKNSSSFGIKAAKAEFLPQLSASAGINRSSSKWMPEDDNWNAGLTLSFPIFEGGLRLAQVAKARAQFKQLEANERSAKDELIVALQEAWTELQDAIETVEVQKKFLDAAQERAKIAEAQYSLGMIQFDSWIIIEDELVKMKKTLLDSQAQALLAEASWIQAKGETIEYAQK
jgi:outer membrane protein TolC